MYTDGQVHVKKVLSTLLNSVLQNKLVIENIDLRATDSLLNTDLASSISGAQTCSEGSMPSSSANEKPASPFQMLTRVELDDVVVELEPVIGGTAK